MERTGWRPDRAEIGPDLIEHAPPSRSDEPRGRFSVGRPYLISSKRRLTSGQETEPECSSGGDGAEWTLIGTLFTGSPHTDVDYFTQGGQIYGSAGTLAASGTAGGQTIFQLSDETGIVVFENIPNSWEA